MSDLPAGWASARLGQLCSVKTGKRDVNEGALHGAYPFFTCAQRIYRINSCPFEGEAILVAGNGFFNVKYFNGKFDAYQRTYVLQNFAIDGKFLYNYIQSELDQITKDNRGSTINYIRLGDLTEHVVPIAPLPEQRRIVARLEKLLSKVDACQHRLAKIPILLKRFRQSVLAAACSGRLTADWREQNPQIENSIHVLSEIKTTDPEEYFDIFEESSASQLPETWNWVRLGKLGRMVGGGTPSKANLAFWKGKIPWVSPKDMKRDRLSDSADHISPMAFDASPVTLLPASSILFVVRGMILNHTLPVAITDVEVTLNQDMKGLIPEKKESSEYLFLASRAIAKNILFSVKEATHGTRRIETPVLKNWAVPFPPLAEQHEIVRRVEALFALADQIEARYVKAAAHVEKLTQSILAKAFRGELVPQDPNDEPVSILLERIRQLTPVEESSKRKTKRPALAKV